MNGKSKTHTGNQDGKYFGLLIQVGFIYSHMILTGKFLQITNVIIGAVSPHLTKDGDSCIIITQQKLESVLSSQE